MKKFFLLAFLPLFLMTSCSSSGDDVENGLPKNSYSVDFGKSVTLEKEGSLAIDNTFIASYSNGAITGKHIGSTEAVFDGKQKIKITVNGTTSFLDYPVTEWGASVSDVRKMHKGGSVYKESDELIAYAIKSGTKYKYLYGYLFENGKLSGATLLVPYTDTEKMISWLKEKYFLMMTGDSRVFTGGYDAYTHDESHTIVGITLESMNTKQYVASYAYLLGWIPGQKSGSRAVEIDQNEDLVTKMCDFLRSSGLME